MDNINVTIIDWLIAEREMLLKINEKNNAVRSTITYLFKAY